MIGDRALEPHAGRHGPAHSHARADSWPTPIAQRASALRGPDSLPTASWMAPWIFSNTRGTPVTTVGFTAWRSLATVVSPSAKKTVTPSERQRNRTTRSNTWLSGRNERMVSPGTGQSSSWWRGRWR